MKKNIVYIVLILLISSFGYAQTTLDNTGGKINNSGTIRIKRGETKALPDTIGGRVEFLQKGATGQQTVPNIVYYQLVVGNTSEKIIGDESGKHLVVRDSLIVADTTDFTSKWLGINPNDVLAEGHISNTAKYTGPKKIIVAGSTAPQNLLGNGSYSNLEIANPMGANVVGGGFTVTDTLTLLSGQLNNNDSNNFKMADTSNIVRYADGSLASSPEFASAVNVTYTGSGHIYSGPELPDSTYILQDLRVESSNGVTLTKNVQVNRSMYIASLLSTEFDSTRRFILTYTPALNPDFSMSPNAQIDGTLRRTGLLFDSTSMLFNNRFTWALFRTSSADTTITAMNFRIKPRKFYSMIPNSNENNVRRTIEITTEHDGVVSDSSYMKNGSYDVGYGWRTSKDDSLEETNGLLPVELVLRHWDESNHTWSSISSSSVPKISEDSNWYYGSATGVGMTGKFVIGRKGGDVFLAARVFLEGAYKGDSMMTNDLYKYNLLQVTPRDEYPYNLDPNRINVRSNLKTMDSIVDWVEIEFLGANKQPKYVTALLRVDGTIINTDGSPMINLTNAKIDSGEYYIGILHRNHLPVYTAEKILITSDHNGQMADFTNKANVYGKENAERLIDLQGGFLLYGMVAGDVNADGVIDATDYKLTWENRDMQFKWTPYDDNLSGYVNTKDINFPWNNRGRSAQVPIP